MREVVIGKTYKQKETKGESLLVSLLPKAVIREGKAHNVLRPGKLPCQDAVYLPFTLESFRQLEETQGRNDRKWLEEDYCLGGRRTFKHCRNI